MPQASWPAWEGWTRTNFTRRFGNLSLPLGQTPRNYARYAQSWAQQDEPHRTKRQRRAARRAAAARPTTVRRFLNEMGRQRGLPPQLELSAARTSASAPRILFDEDFVRKAPEVLGDYTVPEYFRLCDPRATCDDIPAISVGGTGAGAPMHSHESAWCAVIFGSKRWFWLDTSPGAGGQLQGMIAASTLDWFHHDRSEQGYAALKRKGVVRTCVQGPGEIVYTPEGWDHATINLAETVAIAAQFCIHAVDRIPERLEFRTHAGHPMAWGFNDTRRREIAAQETCISYDEKPAVRSGLANTFGFDFGDAPPIPS